MKPKFFSTVLFAAAVSSQVNAANLTWDADLTTTGAQEGPGIWIAGSTNFWDGTMNRTPVKGTDATIIFGNTAGLPGDPTNVVTINNGGALLNYADSTSASSITIRRNYTIAGNAAGDGVAFASLTVDGGVTATISAAVTGGIYTGDGSTGVVPGRVWSVNNGSTLNLSGGGSIQTINTNANSLATPATVNISAGTYTVGGFNADGTPAQFASFGSATNSILAINQTGGTINGGGGNYNIGQGSATTAATTTTYNISGGSLSTGNLSTGGGAGGTGSQSKSILNVSGGTVAAGEIRAGNDGGSGYVNVSGGTVTGNTLIISRNANTAGKITGEANISGGTTSVGTVNLLRTGQAYVSGTTATLNVSGGALYVGAGGIATASDPAVAANVSVAVNLSGGVVGATANWTSAVPMNISNAAGGVNFRAADAALVSRNIGLSGVISGGGTLTKSGGGVLTLNSSTANTFSGGTVITAGSVVGATAGSMGLGNISLTSGLFTSQNADAIADTATLLFTASATPTITLTYTGSDTVGGVSNGVLNLPSGTYNTAQLNSFFGGGAFTGTGSLTIIPEPTSSALLGLGLVSFCFVRKRKTV